MLKRPSLGPLLSSGTARRARDSALRRWLRLPPSVLRGLSGGKTLIEGQLLDAHVQALLFAMRAARVRESEDVTVARREFDENLCAVAPPSGAMRQVRDLSIPVESASLPARLYVPETAMGTPPLLVYFHGGGFVVGSIQSHDAAVRQLAFESGAAVLSVDYRLAPEHKAPAAALDAYAAYAWARAHTDELGTDASRVGVGGDSAGGNVSAVLCHLCRQRGDRQPTVQLLIYPATDLTCSMASHQTFGRGFLLESKRIEWYLGNYLTSGSRRREPMVSPLFWPEFAGLAPAIMVTAGFDPLRDEGKAYAERLREAGVRTIYRCEQGLVHGFFNTSGVVPAARDANRLLAVDLRRAFERTEPSGW